jgi:hypothetical protein
MADLMATPRGEDGASIPERCLNVNITPETGLFGPDGLPIEASSLAAGDLLTVVGHLGLGNDDGPVIQPVNARAFSTLTADGDSDSDSDSHADSDSDSDSDGGTRPPLEFVLTAIVIEKGAPGTFASIRGTLKSGVNEQTDQYGFLVGSGQGFAPDTMLTGQMYPKTRIFSFDGEELLRADLAAEDSALVDGVIVLTDADGESDTLRSAFLLVEREGGSVPEPEPEEDVLVGKVKEVKPETGDMIVATDTGDRCVLADEAIVLFVVDTEGSLEVIKGTLADLPDGVVVVLFGVEDIGGCFDANVVLARSPIKVEPQT